MTALGDFCTHIIAFAEDISTTYPEEQDLARAVAQLKFARRANPRLIYTTFMTTVYDEFAPHILAENEEYILSRMHHLTQNKFMSFIKHWDSMSETNRVHVWKHLKVLVILAQRV